MIKGFVLGKFMPLHSGHLALIDFAHKNCDHLTIITCYTNDEEIPGELRCEWVQKEIEKYPNTEQIKFCYNEKDLPNTSESSREASMHWAAALKKLVPEAAVIFSSELYGNYVAEYMNIKHIMFDDKRETIPIAASQIRKRPLRYWDMITDSARSYFLKKIVLVGSESTGKTTLTEKLALYYETSWVPEMAREIIEKTEKCTYADLIKIAALHAETILKKTNESNWFLFIDTDLTITKSYSEYLFNKKLIVEQWVQDANRFDLYFFLEPDCEFVQDGTRLSETERNNLSLHHKKKLDEAGVTYIAITGNWEQRFSKMTTIINEYYL